MTADLGRVGASVGLADLSDDLAHAVESVCRVLREQGCQLAARTYRAWKQANRLVAGRKTPPGALGGAGSGSFPATVESLRTRSDGVDRSVGLAGFELATT